MFIFPTKTLKEKLIQASVGVGNNKLIPITSFIELEADGEKLEIRTTDGKNYYTVMMPYDGTFDIVVNADMLIYLIKKFTCETTIFDITDDALIIKGNGKYSLELMHDVGGGNISLKKDLDSDADIIANLTYENVADVYESLSKLVSTEYASQCYTHIYCGKGQAVATNRYIMGAVDVPITDCDVLILPEVFRFIRDTYDESCKFAVTKDFAILETNSSMVIATLDCDPKMYGIDTVTSIMSTSYDNEIIIDPSEILHSIERLDVLSNDFDDSVITLKFDSGNLTLSTLDGNNFEVISSSEDSGTDEAKFECKCNYEWLRTAVKAYHTDEIHIWYGEKKTIMLTDLNKLMTVIALGG